MASPTCSLSAFASPSCWCLLLCTMCAPPACARGRVCVQLQMIRNAPKALAHHAALAVLTSRRDLIADMLTRFCSDIMDRWAESTKLAGPPAAVSPQASPQHAAGTPKGRGAFFSPSSPRAAPPASPGAGGGGGGANAGVGSKFTLQQPILRLNPIQATVEADRVGDLRTTFNIFDRDGLAAFSLSPAPPLCAHPLRTRPIY
jgi:hypothetical protein